MPFSVFPLYTNIKKSQTTLCCLADETLRYLYFFYGGKQGRCYSHHPYFIDKNREEHNPPDAAQMGCACLLN